MGRSLFASVVLFAVVACGPLGGQGAPAVTAANVAVQPSDLPGAMHRCDFSGDITSYLKKIQTKDPSTYKTIKTQWEAAQKDGAIAADVDFYADSTAHCADLETNGGAIGSAPYKLAVNFAFEFKDQASAEKGYKSDSIFGFNASALKSTQFPVTEGTATGLGPNSIVLTTTIPNQTFYVAIWQNKQFMIILGLLNFDPATDKKIALAENSRIH